MTLQHSLEHHWECHTDENFSVLLLELNDDKTMYQYKQYHYAFKPVDIDGGIACMRVDDVKWNITFKDKAKHDELNSPDKKTRTLSATPTEPSVSSIDISCGRSREVNS